MDKKIIDNQKVINTLDYLLVASLGIFLAFGPYFDRLVKVVFVVLVLIFLVRQVLIYRRKTLKNLIPRTPLNKPLLYFFIISIASTILSCNFRHSESILRERYLPYLIFFFIAFHSCGNSKRRLHILILSLSIGAVIIGSGGVWNYLRSHPGRLYSSFGQGGFWVTLYDVLVLPILISLALFGKSKHLRLIGIIGAILSGYCLLLSFYRGAWIAVLISILIILYKSKKLALIFLLLLLASFSLLLPQRFMQRALSVVEATAWRDRVVLWQAAVEIIKDFPLLGAGPGMYEKLLHTYNPLFSKKHLHAHNTFLEVGAEMGLLGLVAFVWIFVRFFRCILVNLKRIKDQNLYAITLGISGGVFAALIFDLSSNTIMVGVGSPALSWTLLGIATAGIEIASLEDKDRFDGKEDFRHRVWLQ